MPSYLRISFFIAFEIASSISAIAQTLPLPIRVALYDDAGAAGSGVPKVGEILGDVGAFTVTRFKAADLPDALREKDVVIFTGGSGSKQGNAIGETGRAEVQRFVREGGGYVGICAGAYLACSKFSWSLGLSMRRRLRRNGGAAWAACNWNSRRKRRPRSAARWNCAT